MLWWYCLLCLQGDLPCKRGCYCPEGMVRNSKGQCVLPDDCPCSFGGREYDQGSVTSVGCNEWYVTGIVIVLFLDIRKPRQSPLFSWEISHTLGCFSLRERWWPNVGRKRCWFSGWPRGSWEVDGGCRSWEKYMLIDSCWVSVPQENKILEFSYCRRQ